MSSECLSDRRIVNPPSGRDKGFPNCFQTVSKLAVPCQALHGIVAAPEWIERSAGSEDPAYEWAEEFGGSA